MNCRCHFLTFPLAAACMLAATLTSCTISKSDTAEGTEKNVAALAIDTIAHVVREVRRTSRLYTSEFVIHKIVTHFDDPTIEGTIMGVPIKMSTRIGSRKVAIPIDVTLKAYIDFASFGAQNVSRTDSIIVITLPDPKVLATASKVDHAGTRQYIDPMRSRYSDAEISDFARQGADSIMSHVNGLSIVEQARRSAAVAIIPILKKMGFREEQIVIQFQGNITDKELDVSIKT